VSGSDQRRVDRLALGGVVGGHDGFELEPELGSSTFDVVDVDGGALAVLVEEVEEHHLERQSCGRRVLERVAEVGEDLVGDGIELFGRAGEHVRLGEHGAQGAADDHLLGSHLRFGHLVDRPRHARRRHERAAPFPAGVDGHRGA
jgi:hypothetical protein